MILINLPLKKKLAIYVLDTDGKGTYPIRRAITIAQSLPQSIEIVFLAPKKHKNTASNFNWIVVENSGQLVKTLATIKPDLLLRDSGSTSKDEVEKITQIVPSVIHFDDFGTGGELTNFVFQTLYTEVPEQKLDHYKIGAETFIVDKELSAYKEIGRKKAPSHPIPHLVVTFGSEDESNLTFRVLRHLLHLQIPLKITIVVGKDYKHDIGTLRLMALNRRNTTILQQPDHFIKFLSTADIILCTASYLPYEISVMGIPCIVLAQNEFESSLDFPVKENGFTHLGLGRKVKQSNLLNAIMELILHDDLRKQAVEKQLQLNLGNGQEIVQETILYCLEYPKSKTFKNGLGKKTSDML